MSSLMPSINRLVGRGGIEYVSVASGDAEVRAYIVSKKIEATACSIDGIYLLPELYIQAQLSARSAAREALAPDA